MWWWPFTNKKQQTEDEEDTFLFEMENQDVLSISFELDRERNIFVTANLRDGMTNEEMLDFARMIYMLSTGQLVNTIKEGLMIEETNESSIINGYLSRMRLGRSNDAPIISPIEVFTKGN